MESPQRSGSWDHHRNGSLSRVEWPVLGNSTTKGDGEKVKITVDQTHDGRLGFSLRGGVEHNLNIFISKVETGSPAEQAGLRMGDKLLEVNGVSLENISISSAVKVLTGHCRLRLVLQRVGRVPGVRFTNEKTTWVDLIHRRLVVEEGGISLSDSCSDSALCRKVQLQTSLSQPCLGLNIRGGTEYGLGIYVSKVDPGGLAERSGIKMGDQILSANGVNFEDVTHSRAVEVLKSQSHITLIIKETGRYPAYQEIVAKYSWEDKLSSGTYHSSSWGSDSSCSSSLSSGTPLSSVSGASQATLPVCLPFGAQLADVSGFTEVQLATDPTESASHTEQLNTTLNCGPTELLHDSAIRDEEGEKGRRGEEHTERRKTSIQKALSRSSPSICRTQSHITASEKELSTQKRKQTVRREGEWNSLRCSKTFFGLTWTRHSSTSPSRIPTTSGPGTDRHGDFEVQDTADVFQQNHLLDKFKQLYVTQQPGEVPEPSRAVSPILDVALESCSRTDSLRPTTAAPTLPNWLLTEKTQIPPATDNPMACSDEVFYVEKNGCPENKAHRKKTGKNDVFFTVVDTPRPRRPLLSHVFGPLKRSQSTRVPPTGPSGKNRAQEYVRSGSVSDHQSGHAD